MRTLLLLFAVFLPSPLKRVWYRALFGWKVGRRVRIGLSYLDAAHVEIGDDVRIGHFNLVRSVARFVVGRGTTVVNLNTFSGARQRGDGWTRTLTLGDGVYIASRHFFDVAGDLTVGDGTIIAGRDTHLWTHSILLEPGGLELRPLSLRLGRRCYIGARATLLYCTLPDGCLVGAGSVVNKSFDPVDGSILIAGNPAVIRKTYKADVPQEPTNEGGPSLDKQPPPSTAELL